MPLCIRSTLTPNAYLASAFEGLHCMPTTDHIKNISEKLDSRGRTLRGVVVSGKMKDTVAVLVTRFVKHQKYGKFMKRGKKYLAHDPGNKHTSGDRVTIRETRPISKNKHFKIV